MRSESNWDAGRMVNALSIGVRSRVKAAIDLAISNFCSYFQIRSYRVTATETMRPASRTFT
jgi:hypothetical protein